MLKIDLGTHDREIGELVAQHCAKFGAVLSARVHRTPSPVALVEMKTRDETDRLALEYGGSVFGNCVLIHLSDTAD